MEKLGTIHDGNTGEGDTYLFEGGRNTGKLHRTGRMWDEPWKTTISKDEDVGKGVQNGGEGINEGTT